TLFKVGGGGGYTLYQSSTSFPPCFCVATVSPLGDSPVQISCPSCHQTVLSKVDYSAGLLTYLFCGGLFFCGFVLGCCLIPFCVDRLKDAKHTCPTCKTVLGVYKRL
uniref:Lipopolysaccharide-induced TNF factor n=1 Tax=Amphilophus citrinellus TaxID=61819 RepID=A0A3Q0T8W5_AMPCI